MRPYGFRELAIRFGLGVAIVAGVSLPLGQASAAPQPYFQVGLEGSAGPLRLGMPYSAARRYLHFGTDPLVSGGVTCEHYSIALHSRPGDVYACFDRMAHLVAFRISGDIFCFRRGVCADQRSALPMGLRAGIRVRFDRSNGVYYSSRRERLLGQPYELVFQRPAFDPPWTVKWIGFAPLTDAKLASFILFYVPYGP